MMERVEAGEGSGRGSWEWWGGDVGGGRLGFEIG